MATTSTAATTQPATRRATAGPDAITVLKADHKEVKDLYKQYQKLVDTAAGARQRGQVAGRICAALTAHATAEEEIFYPPAREVIDDVELLDHADVEHACAKDLIAQIQAMSPDETHYDAKVIVLCEYVTHHVKEEEQELFPQVRKSKALDLKALGAEIVARKKQLLA